MLFFGIKGYRKVLIWFVLYKLVDIKSKCDYFFLIFRRKIVNRFLFFLLTFDIFFILEYKYLLNKFSIFSVVG